MFIFNPGSNKRLYNAHGYLVSAASVHREKAIRRDFNFDDSHVVMFDPQLYLLMLGPEIAARVCYKLSTYPWFPGTVPEYDSGVQNQREWFAEVQEQGLEDWDDNLPMQDEEIQLLIRACIDFQLSFGVTRVIIPLPLVRRLDDEFETQLRWIRLALESYPDIDIPILAGVTVMDSLLSPYSPEENPLLSTMMDNLTTQEIDGVYFVVATESTTEVRLSQANIVRSLLLFSHVVGYQSTREVWISHAEDLGFLCMAAGATGFTNGCFGKQRRMCFADYFDRDFGVRLPYFYSHSLIRDFLTEQDLSSIRGARLHRLFDEDHTTVSASLKSALEARGQFALPAEWAERRSNDSAAHAHRAALLFSRTQELMEIPLGKRLDYALDWLHNAEAQSALLESKVPPGNLKQDGRHVRSWREALEWLIDEVNPDPFAS